MSARSKASATRQLGRVSALSLLALAPFALNGTAAQPAPGAATAKPPTATASGTVDAPSPFKAAAVYLKNVDKEVVYTVFTSGGAFKAVALFPGHYEVDAQARGLASDVQKLTIAEGQHPTLKFTLHSTGNPDSNPTAGGVPPNKPLPMFSYDEIYPEGPGKEVAEKVCITCHGENFLPRQPGNQAIWQAKLDYMMGKTIYDSDKVGLGQGILAPPASGWFLGVQDRKDFIAYVSKNFSLDSKARVVRSAQLIPMDEAVLGKAEFIEYYYPNNIGGPAAPSSEPVIASEGYSGTRRNGSFVALDAKGNAWGTDSGEPNKLVKLDPRTGKQTDYPTPVAVNLGLHDMVIDRNGMIWLVNQEYPGPSTDEPMLMMFNPNTEQWKYYNPDPDNQIRTTRKMGTIGMGVDSKGDLYMNWMLAGVISKFEPKTQKTTILRVPTNSSTPYGMYIDKNDVLWFAEWANGKYGKYDLKTNLFSEYAPPTYPINIRRGVWGDSKGNIWAGAYSAGKRNGLIFRFDPKTDRFTQWSIPASGANPYEVVPDREDNAWFVSETAGADQPTFIASLNPKTGKFAFYPKPQVQSGTNKLAQATNGAVWYEVRNQPHPAFGVLYPDKNSITSLAGYPLNGTPGYNYKFTAPKPVK